MYRRCMSAAAARWKQHRFRYRRERQLAAMGTDGRLIAALIAAAEEAGVGTTGVEIGRLGGMVRAPMAKGRPAIVLQRVRRRKKHSAVPHADETSRSHWAAWHGHRVRRGPQRRSQAWVEPLRPAVADDEDDGGGLSVGRDACARAIPPLHIEAVAPVAVCVEWRSRGLEATI